MATRRTRFAPSPTGALHLGNARSFLINWALAKQEGWETALRIEDLDSPRVKPHTVRETIDILRWLGLAWHEEMLTQIDDLSPYRDAMKALDAAGRIFSCALSRKEVEAAASAPQDGARPSAYPRELRPLREDRARRRFDDEATNYRFIVEDESESRVRIDDQVAGEVTIDVVAEAGDFVVWTKRAAPAYQLAVVVDDLRQGITDVVRGDDLLPSAALQTLLYRALGATPPRWWHLPLVVGEDGRRLAKRHGDTRVSHYRECGVSAERIIGLIAHWSGVLERPEPLSAEAFRLSFDLARLPRQAAVFTQEDDAWLLSATSRS